MTTAQCVSFVSLKVTIKWMSRSVFVCWECTGFCACTCCSCEYLSIWQSCFSTRRVMLKYLGARHFQSIWRDFEQICHQLDLNLNSWAFKLPENLFSGVWDISLMRSVNLSQSSFYAEEQQPVSHCNGLSKSDQWHSRQWAGWTSFTVTQHWLTDQWSKTLRFFIWEKDTIFSWIFQSKITELAVNARLRSAQIRGRDSFH